MRQEPGVANRARQAAVLAVLLVAASLLLIVLDGRNMLDPVKGVVGIVIAPVSRGLSDLGQRIAPGPRGDAELMAELDAITEERDRLLAENARLREQVADIDELREQLEFKQAHPELQVLQAGVISRDPQSLEKFIIIDRGSGDGVEVGMAVVSPNFLVGQVVEVDPNRAKVLLLIDSAFQTGAVLQSSRGAGIVYGRWQYGDRAVMRHVPLETETAPGELVVTSGQTAGIPAGLVIGTTNELERDALRNEIEISVIPLVDFDTLTTVTVIVGAVEE
jgi:rod shape-determining protein MreC